MKDISKQVAWVVKNWEKIPDSFKASLKEDRYYSLIPGVTLEEHIVVLLLDRQKPSVQADYSFDEERIAVTRTGKVIWGFDSGCSCPSPWHDNYPSCYSCDKTWKTFAVNLKNFDTGAAEACIEKISEIKAFIRKNKAA